MTTKIACVVLGIVATSFALPLRETGLVVAPGGLSSDSWSHEFLIGNLPVRIAVGYNKDGTIQAGAQVTSIVNDRVVPIAAAVETNLKNTNQISYQVAGAVDNIISGELYGDLNDVFLYGVSGRLPVTGNSNLNAIIAKIEGDRMRPFAVSGGVDLDGQVYLARVGLDPNFKPESINLEVGV